MAKNISLSAKLNIKQETFDRNVAENIDDLGKKKIYLNLEINFVKNIIFKR